MNLHPTALKLLNPRELAITWSDGQTQRLSVRTLRDRCPCASCREQRQAQPSQADLLPVLRPEETRPLGIANMRPVGNYAYSISFTDGHDTGIYTLELLHELGQPSPT
jgi:DUF971 family protein